MTTNRPSKVPEGLWTRCHACGEMLQTKALQMNALVCPECNHHFRMSAIERIVYLSDDAPLKPKDPESVGLAGTTFVSYGEGLASSDPLEFDDIKPYKDRLKSAAEKTGLGDAFISGKTTLRKLPYHLGVFEFRFMGGSMGSVVGEKIALVFEKAIEDRLPAVIISASGGARMQEGILSLMQMAKTTALIQKMQDLGLPYLSILTDPTTGGVAASFAMLGDVILAEPKALIGFAGPRVIQQTIRQKLPEGFQKSEFLLEHGFVDRIVPRNELRDELYEWMLRLGRNTCRFPARFK